MNSYVFCDLDNTIVRHHSRSDQADAVFVGLDEFGKPSTVMTSADSAVYQHALDFGTIIPTTGRSIAEYQRLQPLLPSFTSWAILNHGATILFNNAVDPAWLAKTQTEMLGSSQGLTALYQRYLCHLDSSQLSVRLHQEHSLPLYISLRIPRQLPYLELRHSIEQIFLQADQPDFALLHTGRITSVLPKSINKKTAVLEVMRRLEPPLKTLGIGDSLTDLAFMQCCDQLHYPPNSEIGLHFAGDV